MQNQKQLESSGKHNVMSIANKKNKFNKMEMVFHHKKFVYPY